jgi:hypothetical protein
MGGLSAEHKGSKGSQRGQLSPVLAASGAPTSAFPAKTRHSAGGQANHARRPSGLGRSRPGVHSASRYMEPQNPIFNVVDMSIQLINKRCVSLAAARP